LYLSSWASSTYQFFEHPCYTTRAHIPSHPTLAASLPIYQLVSNLLKRGICKQKSNDRLSSPNTVNCTTHRFSQLYNRTDMIVLYLYIASENHTTQAPTKHEKHTTCALAAYQAYGSTICTYFSSCHQHSRVRFEGSCFPRPEPRPSFAPSTHSSLRANSMFAWN
jgi:hypothetical protein